jgi:hypothetical protein
VPRDLLRGQGGVVAPGPLDGEGANPLPRYLHGLAAAGRQRNGAAGWGGGMEPLGERGLQVASPDLSMLRGWVLFLDLPHHGFKTAT